MPIFGRTKRQRVLKGFNDRGSGWNTVRQVLYFAEFVINVLNKFSTLFKTVFILLQHFLFTSLLYQMNGKTTCIWSDFWFKNILWQFDVGRAESGKDE